MNKFIIKQVNRNKSKRLPIISENVEQINEINNIEVMDTKEKIEMAQAILMDEPKMKVKRIKKDKGLIERVSTQNIVLTEDNRELLKD